MSPLSSATQPDESRIVDDFTPVSPSAHGQVPDLAAAPVMHRAGLEPAERYGSVTARRSEVAGNIPILCDLTR